MKSCPSKPDFYHGLSGALGIGGSLADWPVCRTFLDSSPSMCMLIDFMSVDPPSVMYGEHYAVSYVLDTEILTMLQAQSKAI